MTEKQSNKRGFIKHLERYRDEENRAVLAALRRGHKPEMCYYVLDYQTEQNKDYIYMIASLFALHPQSANSGNMGEHMRRLDPTLENAATERRFMHLLKMRRETIERPLRQCISILKSNEIRVNWNQLYWDMYRWNEQDYRVQEQWTKSFLWHRQSESDSD